MSPPRDAGRDDVPYSNVTLEELGSAVASHQVTVNLEQLRANVRFVVERMRPARLCAVLKNNAYGHGLIPCARAIVAAGVDDIAVVDNHEIGQLRTAADPALRRVRLWRIRPSLPREQEEAIARHWNVIEQVGSLDEVDWVLNAPPNVRVTLNLDCSMGRDGFGVPSHLDELIQAVEALGPQRIAGVMTHLANADGPEELLSEVEAELDDFDAAVSRIKHGLGEACVLHVGNSAAGLRLKRATANYGMIRCGASLFGEATSSHVPLPPELSPCFGWRTWVAHVKELPAGARVGYGSSYVTTGPERVAALPMGYADGLKKGLGGGRGELLVRGVRCPIRGNIGSASAVIGVSHLPGPPVRIGEEVTIIGRQGETVQTPDQLAAAAGTGHLDLQSGVRAPISYRPATGETR